MIGRREHLDFDTNSSPRWRPLSHLVPPRESPPAERRRIPKSVRDDDQDPPVAPEVAGLLSHLRALYGKPFHAGNYTGHGGGRFAGAGYSVDLTLVGSEGELDERGFWRPLAAINFLRALDAAAKDAGAEWRTLYNDFQVAQVINDETGKRNVAFMANGEHGAGLNWHGPAPMVLHFHLDISPLSSWAVPEQDR